MILSSSGKLDEAMSMLNECVKKYAYGDRMNQEFGYFTDEEMGIIYARMAKIAMVQGNNDFARLAAAMALQVSDGKQGREERTELCRQSVQSEVIVCIPIYKAELSVYEKVSLQQANKVLGGYPRCFFAPESLNFDFGDLGAGVKVERFPDYFFQNILSYSALMLNPQFYKRFQKYRYVLIYQLDAFVFKDSLDYFCSLGYDYIGAPMAAINHLWHFIGGRVGNGGLSLRKISACLRMLEQWSDLVAGSALESIFFQWEDIFWGYCGTRPDTGFHVPGLQTALEFAVQENVSHSFRRLKEGWRPFGCHGWYQMSDYDWQPLIEQCGYCLSKEKKMNRKSYPRLQDYRESHSSLNIHYLWGLYCKGRTGQVCRTMERWLEEYPPDYSPWKCLLEELICLWRAMESDKACEQEEKIIILRKMAIALQRSLHRGTPYPIHWNLLITMIPHLQKYDYSEMKTLAGEICEKWWQKWRAAENNHKSSDVCRLKKKKRILVLAKAGQMEASAESFVRHTVAFADAILIDIRLATDKTLAILEKLSSEGLPLILHMKSLKPEDFFDVMDFVLELGVNDFLLPQNTGTTVEAIFEKLPTKADYAVEIGSYDFYMPYAYQDKFALARPLLRKYGTAYEHIITGRNSSVTNVSDELYIVRLNRDIQTQIANGLIPEDRELSDISAFAPYNELKYENG